MKKAVVVMVVLSAIIVLSFSSSHAACLVPPGKITTMGSTGAGSTTIYVTILQTGTTNKYWKGLMPLTSHYVQFFTAAMVGGFTVIIQGDAATCPAPTTIQLTGTLVSAGNITYVQLVK
jgi:hypothetical protein